MSAVSLKVKWKKEKYEVEANLSEPLEVLKAQLFALTNVPPARQKILAKGRQLKEDKDLTKLKNGAQIMLLGTAEAATSAPVKATLFSEDLTEEQKTELDTDRYPVGLVNLGNTCYLNSILQCLRGNQHLKNALKRLAESNSTDQRSLSVALGRLFRDLDRSGEPVTPFMFVTLLRTHFPQFAEKSPQGAYMQQDSDEAFTQLLFELTKVSDAGLLKSEGTSLDADIERTQKSHANLIEDLYGFNVVSKMECKEPDLEEEVKEEHTTSTKLRCHLRLELNQMHQGLLEALEDDVEKRSEKAGRNVLFKKTSRMCDLPPYLNIQLVRFFFKQRQHGKDINKKCKIVRRLDFPMKLDVYDFCTEQLKEEVGERRKAKLDFEDAKRNLDSSSGSSTEKDAKKQKKNTNAMDTSTDENKDPQVTFEEANKRWEEVKNHDSGFYELYAVTTHKGLSADSGHYIAWARQERNPEKWWQFDDDKVSEKTSDEVLALNGGSAAWHMGYMLFYRKVME